MSRQLRLEYTGALYHVYSRGNQRLPIFFADDDRSYFLKTLGEAHEKYELIFQAYCLMPNHYHLSVMTPRGRLSKAMHLINTSYSVYLNKKRERCGHVFQGRFRSVLVEAQSYVYELSRYIHLNPVRAGIVEQPEEYPWSSYLDYLGVRRSPSWLDTRTLLGTDVAIREANRRAYEGFVLAGIGHAPPLGYTESKRSGVLGTADFIDSIRRRCLRPDNLTAPDRERPQLRFFTKRTSLEDIFGLITELLGPQSRLLRSMAIYVSHRKAEYTLGEIAEFYNMSVSGVANAKRRMEAEVERNDTVSRIVLEISEILKTGSNLPSPESNKR